MAVSYVTFMKHAEKVTKTASASRPILKGVYHSKDGSLMVTDTMRLYIAKGVHSNEDESVLNPKTGESIDGNYPDCTRLIPDKYDAVYTSRIVVNDAVKAFNALLKCNQVAGKDHLLTIATVNTSNELEFTISNLLMKSTYKNSYTVDGTAGNMTFNTFFMTEALTLFKDAGVQEVELRYYGALRPFTLTAGKDDELLALLLPVRRTEAL